MINLASEHLEMVKKILADFVPESEVRVFGSRCNGKARKFSDLDLCVCGREKLPWLLLEELKDAFMESDLPLRVDILDYHSIPEHFKKNISNGEVVQSRCENNVPII
ncbi:MAG: nucleotidyltransferase domain-containing protein [Planctomycetaceae bacterium]|jgi:predicted nucleotidyltransferase|nr:nucleotidyltransferase domain-containing protein [Planctomycetaceae bacterium]